MDRKTFIAGFKRKLDEWNADIDHLEERARGAGSRVRGESQEVVSGLRERREEIDEDLKELGRSLGDAWHDLREGLEEAGEDLRAAIADARRRFGHEDGGDDTD